MSVLWQSAVGIDLSDGTLKAVRLERGGGHVTWTRSWRIGCAGERDPQVAALDALATLLRERPVSAGTRLVLSAPSRGVFSRTYMIPAMEGSRIQDLVRYEILAELKLPEEDLVLGQHVHREGVESQVHAWALRRTLVDGFRAALAARGITADALEPPGIALAAFAEQEFPQTHDRVLLAVGEVASELVLQQAGGLWIRHLPLGLQHGEPSELAARFAEELAAAVAYLLPPDQPFAPQELLLTEEGACDAALTTALRRTTGLAITRVSTLQHIRAARGLRHDGHTPEQALCMGKAFGLALSGLGLARVSAPIVLHSSRREAQRRVPIVAIGVLAACVALVGAGEQAHRQRERMNATLPISLQGSMQDMQRRTTDAQRERADAEHQAAVLLGLAQRRPAVLQPRRALAVLDDLLANRGADAAHLDHLWLSTTEPGHPGLMTLTLHAATSFDASFDEELRRTFEPAFPEVHVRGPEAGPVAGQSRWTVEVALP